MKSKTEIQNKSNLDWLRWALVFLLIMSGLFVNYYYNSQPWPLRLLGWLFLLFVVGFVGLQTYQGRQFIDFARESRTELRKVYWPTRQNTVQATLVVAVAVVIIAVCLWIVDTSLMSLIGWLTGQRG